VPSGVIAELLGWAAHIVQPITASPTYCPLRNGVSQSGGHDLLASAGPHERELMLRRVSFGRSNCGCDVFPIDRISVASLRFQSSLVDRAKNAATWAGRGLPIAAEAIEP
jgi:hypothetical protein